jgi:elongation factor Ts
MKVAIETIKELRERTNASVNDCRKALLESKGDLDAAVKVLRKMGLETALQKSQRTAQQGRVEAYIHHGNKIGVMVEVNSETDFVARNEHFLRFTKDLAMQIAAANPRYISKDDVPQEILAKQKDAQSFFETQCLLEQKFIKDPALVMRDYLIDIISKTGENIVIRRFVRYHLGQE